MRSGRCGGCDRTRAEGLGTDSVNAATGGKADEKDIRALEKETGAEMNDCQAVAQQGVTLDSDTDVAKDAASAMQLERAPGSLASDGTGHPDRRATIAGAQTASSGTPIVERISNHTRPGLDGDRGGTPPVGTGTK